MTVYESLSKQIGRLQEMDWTPDGVYVVSMREIRYVTLSKIKRNIAKAVSENGLCISYDYCPPEWRPKATEKKPQHVLIELTATIFDKDGDSIVYHTWGEGAANDEKAVSIARAFQMRAFLIDTFLISDYIEAEESEPEYIPTETAKQILASKAVPQEVPKPSVKPMPIQHEIPAKPKETAVHGTKQASEVNQPEPTAVKPSEPVKTSSAAESADKPLSAIQKKALENMRSTVNDSIDKGMISHNDSVLVFNALDAIDSDRKFREFMAVKGEFGL